MWSIPIFCIILKTFLSNNEISLKRKLRPIEVPRTSGKNEDRIKGAAYLFLQDRLCYSGGMKQGEILNRISCLQKDGSWNDQRKLRNSRMYHLMAQHPCPKKTDHIMICGGYDKSWKHKTDCEIIDENGKDTNLNNWLLRRGFKLIARV